MSDQVHLSPLDPVPGGPRRVRNDLLIRTFSGIAMVSVTLLFLSLGTYAFALFVLMIGFGLMYEYLRLVRNMPLKTGSNLGWTLFGMLYLGAAIACLLFLREQAGLQFTLLVLGSVWAVDIGAYAVGRTVGGPKIAPSISPAKTWSGGAGGAALCVLWLASGNEWLGSEWINPLYGIPIAVLAQSGDFLESWMKRQAGVKDSSSLLPGHGGLFDRLDGMVPVAILATAAYIASLWDTVA